MASVTVIAHLLSIKENRSSRIRDPPSLAKDTGLYTKRSPREKSLLYWYWRLINRATKVKAGEFLENEMGPMTFGDFLVGVRHAMNISQADLARKLKVSRSMICDIEKGRILVSPALAMKIAGIGKFPKEMAIKYCLQDQLRKAKIKMKVNVEAA